MNARVRALPEHAAPSRAIVGMMSRLLALVLLVLVPSTATAEVPARETKADRQRVARIVAIGIGGLVYASTETVFKDTLSADDCRWCDVNGFDGKVRNALVWDDIDAAHQTSNLTGYVSAPLVAAGLLMFSSAGERDRWATLTDDLIPMFETVVYSQLLVQAVKFSVGRQRPFVHYAETPIRPDPDQNLSFFSGHSALVFSIAVSSGMVAHRRGYKLEPLIWATGLGLGATTAYLRIAADKHYLTDVLVGSAFGVLAGFVIPPLTGSLPPNVSLAPTTNGLSLVGTF